MGPISFADFLNSKNITLFLQQCVVARKGASLDTSDIDHRSPE